MNARRRNRTLWHVVTAFVASALLCQEPYAEARVPHDTLLDSAKEIMAEAGLCALATSRDSEAPAIRLMDPFPPDDDMVVWLGTNRNSRKVKEILQNPRVSLFYAAPGGRGYVTIIGRAALVDDAEEKAARWKAAWDAFYADRASEYILIKVTPERVEILDYAHGIAGDPVSWEAPSIQLR